MRHLNFPRQRPKSAPQQRLTKQQPPPWSGLYQRLQWARKRDRYLRDQPWCLACLIRNEHKSADHADHIISARMLFEYDVIEEYFYDERNFQALCRSCHNGKTANERRRLFRDFRRRTSYFIYPAATASEFRSALEQILARPNTPLSLIHI